MVINPRDQPDEGIDAIEGKTPSCKDRCSNYTTVIHILTYARFEITAAAIQSFTLNFSSVPCSRLIWLSLALRIIQTELNHTVLPLIDSLTWFWFHLFVSFSVLVLVVHYFFEFFGYVWQIKLATCQFLTTQKYRRIVSYCIVHSILQLIHNTSLSLLHNTLTPYGRNTGLQVFDLFP